MLNIFLVEKDHSESDLEGEIIKLGLTLNHKSAMELITTDIEKSGKNNEDFYKVTTYVINISSSFLTFRREDRYNYLGERIVPISILTRDTKSLVYSFYGDLKRALDLIKNNLERAEGWDIIYDGVIEPSVGFLLKHIEK